MRIRLDFTLLEAAPVDVQALHLPEIFKLSAGEIEHVALAAGKQLAALGEMCKVTCAAAEDDELAMSGDTRWLKHAGRGMASGRLVIDGDVGYGAGMEMSGGELEVLGNAGDGLGTAMQSGLIRLHGRAGDWCGAGLPGQPKGMTGGTILVGGNAGSFTGMSMRRGLVWVGGDCGNFCGDRLLAGTILCAGKVGRYSGRGMRRGSIVAGQMDPPLPGFQAAGRADSEWLRIYARALERLGVDVPSGWLERSPRRFSGDHLELGKGEILVDDLIE